MTKADLLSIEEAWQDLLDKDDRTSPADYPEMCLITRDELADYMESARRPYESPGIMSSEQWEATARRPLPSGGLREGQDAAALALVAARAAETVEAFGPAKDRSHALGRLERIVKELISPNREQHAPASCSRDHECRCLASGLDPTKCPQYKAQNDPPSA